MTDKDVERVAAEIEQVFAADPICSGLFCASTVEAAARAAVAAYESALADELRAVAGYLRNAKIDLETGAPKATAIRTIDGGLKRIEAALTSTGE
jgi:hypothetical protein